MVNGGQDGDLGEENEDAAANRDEDLAHDEVADGLVGAAEVDHQALREDVQRDRDVEEPLEVARPADQVTDDQEENAGHDVKCVANVSGLGDGHIVDDLQEGREEVGPAVIGDLVCDAQYARADDGSVGEKGKVEHGFRG